MKVKRKRARVRQIRPNFVAERERLELDLLEVQTAYEKNHYETKIATDNARRRVLELLPQLVPQLIEVAMRQATPQPYPLSPSMVRRDELHTELLELQVAREKRLQVADEKREAGVA